MLCRWATNACCARQHCTCSRASRPALPWSDFGTSLATTDQQATLHERRHARKPGVRAHEHAHAAQRSATQRHGARGGFACRLTAQRVPSFMRSPARQSALMENANVESTWNAESKAAIFDTRDVGLLFKSLFDSAGELDDQAEVDVVVAARRTLGDLWREETSEDDAVVAGAGAADEAEPNRLDQEASRLLTAYVAVRSCCAQMHCSKASYSVVQYLVDHLRASSSVLLW